MKRFFAIVLLTCVFAMNMDMLCRSLCMVGHGNMNHASHSMAKHEMPQGEMCPIGHEVHHNMPHEAHHSMPQTAIKCDCSADQAASLGFEFTSADAALDVTPYLRMVSTIQPQSIIFLSQEPIPLEGPPKLIS